jgi:hypothetical protein
VADDRLADPVNQYPNVFGQNRFLARYPYALPNLVTASLLLSSCIFGLLFLAETHDAKKGKRDLGMKVRQLVRGLFRRSRPQTHDSSLKDEGIDEEIASVPLSPSSQWTRQSNNPLSFKSNAQRAVKSSNPTHSPPRPPFRAAFTKQVVLNMFMFAGIAVQNNTFGQLFPLLCSTRTEDGGLGMTPGQIGAALSAAGIMAVVFQVTIFPWGYNRWGGLICLRVILAIYPCLYFVCPLRSLTVVRTIPK